MADPNPQQPASRIPALRLEHLWAILAVSLVAGFISLVPTVPTDFWWHLKAGELVATGGIPRENLFAWTLPADHPYVYQSWLGEWLFYALYWAGGFPLVIFARNLLGAIAFGMVAVETHARSGSWRLAALATVAAGLMTTDSFIARTQIWSWVPFMATLYILGRYAEGRVGPRWLLALPAIMIFWVNAHGAFVMGVLLTGAFAVGETARRLLRQPWAPSWERLRWLYLALAGTMAATLLNPQGPAIYGYLRTMLGYEWMQENIKEWLTPTPNTSTGFWFYLAVLLTAVAFAYARRRPTISELLVVCGLAWQGFDSSRSVLWFALGATPLVVQTLAAPRPALGQPAPRRSPRERGGGAGANLAAAALMVAIPLLLQPWIKPLLPLPADYRALFADVPGGAQLFSAGTPVAAVDHLRAEPCAGPIFNDMAFGSYMAWALYPAAQSFIDSRVELYPVDIWLDYLDISDGKDVEVFVARYGLRCALLEPERQAGLIARLTADPGWRKTFDDGNAQVWRRE